MSRIDWSKAGVRIRRTPTPPGSRHNPDWDMRHDRWKDEADYAGEAMSHGEVAARVTCPVDGCSGVIVGRFCHDALGNRMDSAHFQRSRLAGEQAVAEKGAGETPGGNDG